MLENKQIVLLAMQNYENVLLRYSNSMIKDYERAQDIVQDTFLQLCKADMTLVNKNLKAWLFKVCRNRTLEIMRKEKKMQPLTDEDNMAIICHNTTPDVKSEKNDTFSLLLSLIDKLPQNQKEVVCLKFQSNMSYQEISDTMSLTPSNVGFILHSAMKELRKMMPKEV